MLKEKEEEKVQRWREQQWFPDQGEWKWVEVSNGQIKTVFDDASPNAEKQDPVEEKQPVRANA